VAWNRCESGHPQELDKDRIRLGQVNLKRKLVKGPCVANAREIYVGKIGGYAGILDSLPRVNEVVCRERLPSLQSAATESSRATRPENTLRASDCYPSVECREVRHGPEIKSEACARLRCVIVRGQSSDRRAAERMKTSQPLEERRLNIGFGIQQALCRIE
jgi:hypothetical protein